MQKNDEDYGSTAKPIRNIFKMSRVLVSAKNKFKEGGKANSERVALKKINDADIDPNGIDDGNATDDNEMQYSVSSESEDDDGGGIKS
jgi:hypothetical protein